MNELKSICQKIIAGSSPKGRANHPLYTTYIDEIINYHDTIFGHKVNLSPSRKITSLANELEISENHKTGIICACCGIYTRDDIRQHIKLSHKMTVAEYKERYNQEVISDKTKSIYSDKLKGKRNPWFNHQGKFSANSKNFIKYKDKTEAEVEKDLAKVRSKISKSNRENSNNDTTMLFYTKRGYTIDEAKVALKERQTTFSFDKCIEMYGVDKGTKLWKERQSRWQDTLNNKTQDEIDEINRKKGQGLNSGYGVQRIRKGYNPFNSMVYYIKFFNNEKKFWKIGITAFDVNCRFGDNAICENRYGLNYEVIDTYNDDWRTCFLVEQYLLKQNKYKRIKIDYNGFKSSECFNEDVLNSKLEFSLDEIGKLANKYNL